MDQLLDAVFGNSAAVRSRHYVQFCKDKESAQVLYDDEILFVRYVFLFCLFSLNDQK
ncbi:MAG: hypothetical protein LBT46_15710 [Planctomycetaceae bacterium]|jgi:hypothetical protein|nr:hypothetical protein [Planctomycetaceae bacterium]